MAAVGGGTRYEVTVIGAGIVGVCSALRLLQDGHRVVMIDPRPPGTACSFGNAGIIAEFGIAPYSLPELWREVPRMLLDRTGPLTLPWRHLHRSLPWSARFLAAGATAPRVHRFASEMSPFMARALAAHRELMRTHGVRPELMRAPGYLELYRDPIAFDRGSRWRRELFDAYGVRNEVLGPDELFQLEPGLARRFERAWFFPDLASTPSPIELTQGYMEAFLAAGGTIRHESVRGFEMGAGGPRRVITDLGMYPVDRLLLSAGAWSRELAGQLGSRVPLEAERGYHVNVPWSDGIRLNRPLIVASPRYSLVPMGDGIRVTTGTELGGVELPPRFTRIRHALAHARSIVSGLNGEVNREWMGHRPSMPDSKPVVCRSPRFPRVYFAFGHGHLGLTLSAVTAEAVSHLVAERPFEVDLAPFHVARF